MSLADNDLTDWNFGGHSLSDAKFYSSVLTNTNFHQANLDSADFHRATLTDADLSQANFTNARFHFATLIRTNLQRSNLENARFLGATLTGADLSRSNLESAVFSFEATLTDADLTDAVVVGATFKDTTSRGFTAEQLYSTASYKAKDLHDIRLLRNDLTDWNFAGQNLENAFFLESTVTAADFSQSNLRNAWFVAATLTDANLTDTVIVGANFEDTTSRGFTAEQIYSTASYKAKDLHDIDLRKNDLTGWDFTGQNFDNATFYRATLTGTDFSFSDLRGTDGAALTLANTINTIFPNGSVNGLDLRTHERLVVRDHDLPLTVEDSMDLAESSTLELVFADATWGSTIRIETGVIPDLGGTLALHFDGEAKVDDLVDMFIQLFDWNGFLSPENRFDQVTSDPGHVWDTSQLYTTGVVHLEAVPEPSSIVLTVIALCGLLLFIRRRRVR